MIRLKIQCALDISRLHRSYFFEDLMKDTGELLGVVRDCKVWSKLHHCNCCSVYYRVIDDRDISRVYSMPVLAQIMDWR